MRLCNNRVITLNPSYSHKSRQIVTSGSIIITHAPFVDSTDPRLASPSADLPQNEIRGGSGGAMAVGADRRLAGETRVPRDEDRHAAVPHASIRRNHIGFNGLRVTRQKLASKSDARDAAGRSATCGAGAASYRRIAVRRALLST